MKSIKREELYDMVWSEPTVKVAKRLGVSDVAVAKLCKRLAVPKPPLGYWAKKAAGKPMHQAPLPPLPEGVAAEATVAAKVGPEGARVDDSEFKKLFAQLPEPNSKFNFRSAPWDSSASEGLHRRIAALASVIDQVLRDQGAVVTRQRDKQLYELKGQTFSFKVDEKEETVVVGYEKPDLESMSPLQRDLARRLGTDKPSPITRRDPTGRLVLSVTGLYATGYQQTWSDTKQTLEEKVQSVLAGVFRLVQVCRAREEARQEEGRRYFEQRKPDALHTLRKEHLAFVLDNWREAFELRKFIADVERHVGDRPRTEPELQAWLDWLRGYADRVDPITSERFFIPFSDGQIADEVNVGRRVVKPSRPWEAEYDQQMSWLKKGRKD